MCRAFHRGGRLGHPDAVAGHGRDAPHEALHGKVSPAGCCWIAVTAAVAAAAPAATSCRRPLVRDDLALDTAVFDAFNHCSSPEQLQKHASYFAPDVEFYHDTGGVTWSRQDMLANTEKYVCGHFRRELVPGTLKVFPIKDFGAIAQGSHRFAIRTVASAKGLRIS
jgi:hypothetical protein